MSFPFLHEMLLHCSADVQSISLLCTWMCIALSTEQNTNSTHVERWLYHLIFFHCAALQALTLRLSQALVLLVACSGPSNNFLYGSHYTRDGHYHLGNRFPLQLLQKPPTGQLHWHSQDQLYHLNCDVTEPINLKSKWWLRQIVSTGLVVFISSCWKSWRPAGSAMKSALLSIFQLYGAHRRLLTVHRVQCSISK